LDLGLKNKIAVVTASSKGLGKAAAEALAKEGANVAICSRKERNIRETGNYLTKKYGAKVLAYGCDISKKNEVEDFKNSVIKNFKTVHILVTLTGGPPPGKALDFKTEDIEDAIEQSMISTVNLIYSFLPYMKKQKWGRIISSTSITVKQPLKNLVLSNTSRIGVIGFVKTLSMEISKNNINSNIIAPGYIMTQRVRDLINKKSKEQKISFSEAKNEIINAIPLRRIGKPDEFGSLIAFLASEKAAYINGETILIDGGQHRGLF